jgi:cell division protein FtsQ
LLTVLTVLVGGYLLFFTSLLGVRSVVVTGVSSVTAEQVKTAAAIPDHRALFRVDTDEVRDRVLKLPGVASAEVSRSWPSTVEIKVVERSAIGYFERGDGIHLVDGKGVDFGTVKDKPAGLPQLKLATIAATDPSTQAITAVLAAIPQELRGQVVSAGAATPGSVEFTLGNGKRVRWGSVEQTDRKAKILTPLLTRKGTTYDVSSPELPTVS